jgi:hypothetical protein
MRDEELDRIEQEIRERELYVDYVDELYHQRDWEENYTRHRESLSLSLYEHTDLGRAYNWQDRNAAY